MNRINIYLTPDERKELDRLKNKYYLSYSTIGSIIASKIGLLPELIVSLSTHYFDNKKGYKTSIKPRRKELWEIKNPSIFYTNAIKIFLHKELDKYIDKKQVEKINNWIYSEFQNTHEDSWNGNQLSRFIPKFFKQNKEYSKKLLDIE